jgi:hypothetical protein
MAGDVDGAEVAQLGLIEVRGSRARSRLLGEPVIAPGPTRRFAMSQVDAKSFLERFTKNDAFRREVTSKLQEGAERTPQQLIQLGAQHGLTFTETEIVDAWEESQSTDQRALSDSELDGVIGGKLLEAAVKGKVFKKVEIHGTATYGDAGEQVYLPLK